MGMSASQARFLCLTARKTNVEYEGQQINQQRTTLSNESSNYYSQLTSMSVPTPPSSADYTKITYTFENGNELNTITSLVATKDATTEGTETVKATKESGIYKLNYVQQIPQDSMIVDRTDILSRTGSTGAYEYFFGSNKLQVAYGAGATIPANAAAITGSTRTDIENRFIDAGMSREAVYNMSAEELFEKIKLEEEYFKLADQKYYVGDGKSKWHVRYIENPSTGNFEPLFYKDDDLEKADYNEKTTMSLVSLRGYVYGPSTETREVKNVFARVEQDATGRYIGIITYPTGKDANENTNGTYYELTTTTESDEAGYNDAMNQYYYDKAIYDQKVQEINAKIEIIQIQDKNLELKLKQLDTEENAISTEMDAVKKVISKNVESSFKTFNA